MSPGSAASAVTGAPTFVPAALFSGTSRAGLVSEKTGALAAEFVRTASEGSDQALGVSPLSARTCT